MSAPATRDKEPPMNMTPAITAATPGAERIITVAQRPGTTFVFDTFDETGRTGADIGTVDHQVGMNRLGNQGYAVTDLDGNRHNVSRYAYVVPVDLHTAADRLLSAVYENGA